MQIEDILLTPDLFLALPLEAQQQLLLSTGLMRKAPLDRFKIAHQAIHGIIRYESKSEIVSISAEHIERWKLIRRAINDS